jgi:Outer membrane protein beta-barrel domain
LSPSSSLSDQVNRSSNHARAILGLVLVGLGTFSESAPAQSSWSGALSGGYATGVDNSDFSHGSGALALAVFRGGGGKLQFGAEVGYDHHESWSEVVQGRTFDYDQSAWHLAAMLRLRSPSGSVRPYGLVGLGVYALRVGAQVTGTTGQDNEDFVAPGLNLGTGLEFHPGDGPLGLSAGARFHLAGRPANDALGGAGFLALLLGVTYR